MLGEVVNAVPYLCFMVDGHLMLRLSMDSEIERILSLAGDLAQARTVELVIEREAKPDAMDRGAG